ncbi:MAG TPA: hypothetical protein VMV94_10840 [Phycisphaerae bacterium]|nr:hypothetical protein [Phycisphaerae bacterium]
MNKDRLEMDEREWGVSEEPPLIWSHRPSGGAVSSFISHPSSFSFPSRPSLRRRSYILILVLGFTAVVTALGWAYLTEHSTVMPEAVNRYGGVRAQYLAESGVGIASHFLMYPPTTVGGCDYWHGATGIAVDSTNDYTDVTVAQDATNSDTFTITAVGVAKNPDSSIRGKHTVTAKVIRPAQNKVKIPYALLGDASLMSGGSFEVPSSVNVYGNVHANGGQLWGYGWCNGAVTATDWLCWMSCGGSGPPTSVTGWVSSYSLPSFSAANYASYTVNGNTYTAYAYSDSNIDATKSATLNAALDATMATNPGRIVTRSGNLSLNNGTVVNATLVITGNCQLNGDTVQLTAVQDYPALVIIGNLVAQKDNTTTTVVGSLYVSTVIMDNNKNGTRLNVTGACILKRGFNLLKSTGSYNFTWDCARATFWDFANASTGLAPITYLSWQEN